MKKTQKRSIQLLERLKENAIEQRQNFKDRNKILSKGYPENIENQLLDINTDVLKDLKDFEKFCLENIVSWHLDQSGRIFLSGYSKPDNTATAAVHGW